MNVHGGFKRNSNPNWKQPDVYQRVLFRRCFVNETFSNPAS